MELVVSRNSTLQKRMAKQNTSFTWLVEKRRIRRAV
jgi:hypothetical protein